MFVVVTPTQRPATAADVAALAGVSRATVSHIFTGRAASFAEETRARVLQAASELDYRPSPAGRSLVRGHSDTIVVLVPNSTIGQNQQDALDRLTDDTASFGANVVLRFADSDTDATVTAILRMRPLAVVDLGAALPDSARDRLASQGVPTVPDTRGAIRSGTLHLDDLIAETQVRELTRRGARPVTYAALDDGRPDPWSPARFAAIQRACERRGLTPPSMARLPVDADGALDALGPYLRKGAAGVAAYNDTVAIAVMSVAHRLGLAVPDDVSVVGVDNTPLSQLVAPRLTTIDVNMDVVIDSAVEQLSEALETPIRVERRSPAEPLTLVRGETT